MSTVQTIEDVPALNVKFVDGLQETEADAPNVTVLDPSNIVLTLLLLDDKVPAVTL